MTYNVFSGTLNHTHFNFNFTAQGRKNAREGLAEKRREEKRREDRKEERVREMCESDQVLLLVTETINTRTRRKYKSQTVAGRCTTVNRKYTNSLYYKAASPYYLRGCGLLLQIE